VNKTALEVRNLVKRFGSVTAVDDVSFKVEQGEVVTLLGPSGCGKTTTLRMVAGFERPDSGEVEIQNQLVVSTSRRLHVPPEKRGIGMVFQSYAIWPHMTVFENVAYPLSVRGTNRQEVKRRVEETLELVGLGGFSSRPAILLSGGQQQRVSLARALVYSPDILLLDEPLSNLDAKLREQMRIELKRLQEQLSVTVLFVTHDQIEAMSLSTRLAVMNQGRIEQMDAPQEIYEHPKTPFVEDFLGRILRFHGTVIEKDWSSLQVELEGVGGARLRIDGSGETLTVGERALVAIRPESLHLEPSEGGAVENKIHCTIENILYLGRDCELVLRFGNRVYPLIVPRTMVEKIGKSVGLRLPAEQLRVWAAAKAAVAAETDGEVQAGASASTRPGLGGGP
jgi:ABC-type Fe3+/spermidine/putrescine transport system ATPase subunit